MANLRIHRVEYSGDKYHYKSPELKPGLNILGGDNRSGKTTFMDLIYYCLSGNPVKFQRDKKTQHRQVMSDTNNYVELIVFIDEKKYKLKRFIDENKITVFGAGEIKTYPIFRGKSDKITFSDWILEKIGIEVIEIFQGHRNWKFNFNDVLRLLYHDQEPNPKRIYKEPDSKNFITDSELVRKIIFQMLIGKRYSEYYQSISEYKQLQNDKRVTKNTLEEYDALARRVRGDLEDLNLVHLNERKEKIKAQIDRLKVSREATKQNRPRDIENFDKVEELKSQLVDLEIESNELQNEEKNTINELYKYRQLLDDLVREATQIEKIIETHEELNLFTPNTCPYCLRHVDREEGKCVCGNDIKEEQYEKFFYDSSEYLEILSSKRKSVETVNNALREINAEKNKVQEKQERINQEKASIKSSIQGLISKVEGSVNIEKLDEIDDKLHELRDELSKLEQRIDIEEQRETYQQKYDRIKEKLKEKKRKMDSLEINAEEDISEKIHQFNTKYNELMKNTLKECRSASIDQDTYLPVINEGEYNAASASVPKRFNYYLTLLNLAVNNGEVKHPRFLMIDTPQTAGIERKNLIKCLNQIDNVVNPSKENHQIILTTAIDLYPERHKEYVFDKVTEDDKLLNKVDQS